MKRVARVEQNPNGMYSISIYDINEDDQEAYVFGATVLTPVEYQKIAWEYGVSKNNLSICIGRDVY